LAGWAAVSELSDLALDFLAAARSEGFWLGGWRFRRCCRSLEVDSLAAVEREFWLGIGGFGAGFFAVRRVTRILAGRAMVSALPLVLVLVGGGCEFFGGCGEKWVLAKREAVSALDFPVGFRECGFCLGGRFWCWRLFRWRRLRRDGERVGWRNERGLGGLVCGGLWWCRFGGVG